MNTFRPRLRILHGEIIALGPGKVDLLAGIEQTKTIAEAARRLGMSYSRAWSLVQTMNSCFRQPLVETVRGGTGRGSAELTVTGKAVLDLYRRMEEECARAADPLWRELRQHLQE